MRTEQIQIFQYDELTPEARARARDWYREVNINENDWADWTVDDFVETLETLGFEVSSRRGHSRASRAVYWDTNPAAGAFDASWSASRVDPAAIEKFLADRPATYVDADGKERQSVQNRDIAIVARELMELAKKDPEAYGSTNTLRHFSMDVEFSGEGREEFEQLCRDLGEYLAIAIREEWEYQDSDEVIADNIRANEYEFTANGSRWR